jgi:hypothetical protein
MPTFCNRREVIATAWLKSAFRAPSGASFGEFPTA